MAINISQTEIERVRERAIASHGEMLSRIDNLPLSSEERISLTASIYEFARWNARERVHQEYLKVIRG